ncbi:MAG: cytochrome c1 [Kiloniellaceae bacterium]
MKRLLIGVVAAVLGLGWSAAQAAEEAEAPGHNWSFSGIFGTFDRAAQQRGFQVYKEVCAGCHSLDLVAFRHLEALGFSAEEVKAIAAEYTIIDGPNDDGEMFERPGRPSDFFPPPFPNDKAAAAANGGAIPPDLSLMAKAREGGPDYLRALLTGYVEPPGEFDLIEGLSYNLYFPNHQIAMPPPLFEGAVEFADGTEASVEQMAGDVTTFLMWAAEPNLEARKEMGIKVMLFLLVFTGLLYAAKRRVWSDLH